MQLICMVREYLQQSSNLGFPSQTFTAIPNAFDIVMFDIHLVATMLFSWFVSEELHKKSDQAKLKRSILIGSGRDDHPQRYRERLLQPGDWAPGVSDTQKGVCRVQCSEHASVRFWLH